jgi:hypothetical protein
LATKQTTHRHLEKEQISWLDKRATKVSSRNGSLGAQVELKEWSTAKHAESSNDMERGCLVSPESSPHPGSIFTQRRDSPHGEFAEEPNFPQDVQQLPQNE